MGRPLPIVRPVDPDWSCQHSGDCCTIPPFVYMTTVEMRVVQLAASVSHPDVRLNFVNDENKPGFVALTANPCPLHVVGVDGRGRCGIYSSRPYNCRRFACMRPDPVSEPWEGDETGSGVGCRNLLDRLATSRVARRMFALIQRRAQKWAIRNGWSPQPDLR